MKAFYWVLGAIALVGTGLLIFFAARGFSNTGTLGAPLNATVGTLTQGLSYTTKQGQQITTPENLYYKGNPSAPVKVVAYEDFQCPGCGNFARLLEPQLNKAYIETGKVQFVFHDFPLSQHANAPKAAEAARCAGDQGQFWRMHDLLYNRQDGWSDNGRAVDLFIGYASELSLDRTAFTTCINSGKYTTLISEAGMAAQKANIPYTPAFVVNGQLVQAPDLFGAIDAVLKVGSR